jgi:hypothetical protein
MPQFGSRSWHAWICQIRQAILTRDVVRESLLTNPTNSDKVRMYAPMRSTPRRMSMCGNIPYHLGTDG